jgi:hypothetical protein
MAKHILKFETGKKTCAVKPGKFCRFMRSRRFGSVEFCALYEKELFHDEPLGWLQRCEECLVEVADD